MFAEVLQLHGFQYGFTILGEVAMLLQKENILLSPFLFAEFVIEKEVELLAQ